MNLTVGEHTDDKEQESLIEEYANYLKPKSVLEVGCGKGRLAPYFSNTTYMGIDKNKEDLPKKTKHYSDFKHMRAPKIDFPDRSFDMSFTCTVLTHNKNGDDILREMIRVTHRYILLIEAKNGWMFIRRHDYENICKDAGFELWDYRTLRTSDKLRLSLWFFRRKRTRLPKVKIE